MNRPDWDQYFMSQVYLAASRSQDASTHAGAVIVRQDNSVVSTGYNSPIRGMDIEDVPQERPHKYFYMEHGERNAIYNAAKHGTDLDGCKLYVNFLPCADCARAIVQSGIVEVIVHKEGQDAFDEAVGNTEHEWDDSHQATMKIFSNGVKKEIHLNSDGTKDTITYEDTILRWWSGELWMPKGYFRGKEFKL